MDVSKLLNLKLGRISVDIDVTHRWDVIDLVFSLMKAKKYFGDKVYLRMSASKRGFHIVILEEVNAIENLIWRGFLYDDANRIRYCLSRIAMSLLMNKTPNSADVDLLFVAKKYGFNKPFKKVTPIKIEDLFGNKLEEWSKKKINESIKDINEYIDVFAEKLGITDIYIVYGKIDDTNVELIQKVKLHFMHNTKWKVNWITDPYDGTKVLAKIDVANEEEAKEVMKILKELGVKETWYIKRRF